MSPPTVPRVTFDLPECKEPFFFLKKKETQAKKHKKHMKMERNASKKKET